MLNACDKSSMAICSLKKKLDTFSRLLPKTVDIFYKDNRINIHIREKIKNFFLDENKVHLLKREVSKKSPIIRSIISKSSKPNIVIDLTGGFGFDALQIACYGINVVYVERDPLVFLIFNEFLSRVALIDINIATSIKTINLDSILFCEIIKRQISSPDVIYLDPMFPTHYKRRGKEKKYMQVLKEIVKKSHEDENVLFNKAYEIAKKKVVIKRPSKIKPSIICGKLPTHQVKAKGHRFDVYVK